MDLSISMPGAFLPDHDHDPVRPTLTRASVNSSVFLPPQSPSAASSLSRSIRSIPRTISDSANGSRKRARLDTSNSFLNTPRTVPLQHDSVLSVSAFSDAPSPHPFVNTNYRIAGGLDTPTAAQSLDSLNVGEEEQDYRQSRFTLRQPQQDGYFPQTPALLGRDRNGRKRARSNPPRSGWSTTVWAYTGGVAGKVLNFCWTSAFSGFHAGGGRGYQMETTGFSAGEQSIWTNVGQEEDVFNANYRPRGSTPIPGEFPKETFIEDYMSHPQSYQESEILTPTQSDRAGGGSRLNGEWTIVNESDAYSRESSPVRKRPKSSANILEPRRPVSRGSIANRPKLVPSRSSLTNASFASPRAGGAMPQHAQARPSTSDGHGHSPAYSHRRSRSSITSPRRTDLQLGIDKAIPASPEVKEFEKKIRRKEKVQDESIAKMNRRLTDMIRQGKEALGTTVEVHDDDEGEIEDEGYAEGSDGGRVDKWWD